MRTFLVTGGAGFIGSHLVGALVERGDRVRVLDNLSTGKLDNLDAVRDRVEFVHGDVLDRDLLARLVEGVDCVFHEAAMASVPQSLADPLASHAACATGTVAVLDAARRAGVRRVVFAASSAAYGDDPAPVKREDQLPTPISPYGAAKVAGELYCRAFAESFPPFETVCLRYFNVFGPRQDPAGPYSAVIPLFVTALLAGRQPIIYGDGSQSRDFCYVADVVQANLLATDAPGVSGQTFNVGTGKSVDLLELLRCLDRLLNLQTTPQLQPARLGDVRESLADISRARERLGFKPAVDFEEGLRRSIEYYRGLAHG